MAKQSFQNLLLLIALTILRSISATTSSPSPPPNQETDALIEALLYKGGFTIWANMLAAASRTSHYLLPTNATLFIPSDAAAISHLSDMKKADLIPYHVTPQHHLLYSELCHLKPLSLLPTLVPSKTILVTSTLPSNYRVDNSFITHPNLYLSSRFAVHGIDHILNLHPQRSRMPPLFRVGDVLQAANTQGAT